jgi:bacteriorhodopsin
MMTFTVLAIYILGVIMAFYQLQEWHKEEARNIKEFQTLFMLSMLSWLIYPIYGVVWLIKNYGEDDYGI